MKKIILFLCFFSFAVVLQAQVSTSVLATGDWYQFSVDTSGVFKIDRTFLQQLGINTSNLNPKKIHIYGNGGAMLPELNSDPRRDDLEENAIFVSGEEDGVFNGEDYILFYAQGPHSWKVNPATGVVAHQQNIYSDVAYYFITINGNDGKRIRQEVSISGTASLQLDTFDDYVFYETENTNLFAAGRQWFGEDFSIENSQTFRLPFDNVVPNSLLTLKVRGAVASALSSTMQVRVGSQNIMTLRYPGVNPNSLTKAFASERTATFTTTTSQIEVTIDYANGGNPSARSFLDYIELSGKKQLIVTDKQFAFRNFQAATTNQLVTYQLQNATNIMQLWNVTSPTAPVSISNTTSGANFEFNAQGGILQEYVVVHPSDFYLPKALPNARVANQNLHALSDIEYLIITSASLSSEAQRLADYHTTKSGLTAQVVDLSQIYLEFASGSKDITGIRDFIKHLYTTNTTEDRKLKYVCFFGDASYDYKDRITGNTQIVPVYESFESFNLATSYVTDDYFVMLDDNEGTMSPIHTVDVASGRIPVSDLAQAKQVVDKILSYYEATAQGDWRNTITLLSDDIDATSDIDIQKGVEVIADSIAKQFPVFNVQKIYADAFTQENSSGGERYPNVQNAITNAIEKGSLLFDYFGHGGEDGFAAERFLDRPQIQGFSNAKTLPLLITITCEFTRFDNPNRTTAGELMFWNPQGGASAMITTTREVFISVGQQFNEDLIKALLSSENNGQSFAEVLKRAKNEFTNFQKFFIYAIGDPAMALAIPKPNIEITKMNGVAITQSIDTLKALSKVQFEGVITDNTNTVLTNYNGVLYTTVFDKPIDRTTLDNDGFGVQLPFDSQESKLFKGKATITNGTFNFDFIVPKDVRIAYGKGKLSFYATNQTDEKSGYNLDVIVGGINPNAVDDTTGPEIRLFMNDESFIDGGNTNTSPNLIANLSDLSGINTSITAVDHDIVAVLDGDESNPIVLNDFYETDLNDFTKGKVTYPLRDLEVGPHTLTLKAWDTYNNSSEATLHFVVVSDASLTLDHVLNYPNPFVNYTEFWFQHNKPNEPLEVQVQIFTISGKLIKTIQQQIQTTGNLSRTMQWNGLDDFGNKIGKGVYIYKLQVNATSSNLVAQQYQKLVILQ